MQSTFKCIVEGCEIECPSSRILRQHVQVFHLNMKKFECPVCKKLLASRQNLKEHSYIHTGEKPYTCQEPCCGAVFRQGTHLSAHKRLEHSFNNINIIENPRKFNKVHLAYLTSLLSRTENYYSYLLVSEEKAVVLPKISPQVHSKLPNIFKLN